MRQSVDVYNTISLVSSNELNVGKLYFNLTDYPWTQLTFQAMLEVGSIPTASGRSIYVYYAFTNDYIDPTVAYTRLDKAKTSFTLKTFSDTSTSRYYISSPITITGSYLYIWVTHYALGAPVVLQLKAVDCSPTLANVTVSTETATPVTAASTSTTLAAENATRTGLSIFNDSDKVVYVKHGTSASATSFKVKLPIGAYYEMPQPIYTGAITGIWEAGVTGKALVSETSSS